MQENSPDTATAERTTNCASVFRLMDPTDPLPDADNEMIATGTISLFGVHKSISIQMLDRFAGLSDLIPLAWALSDVIMDAVLDRARRQGKKISCQKKCAACCDYLVPLAIPEAIHLYGAIEALPAERSRAMWHDSLSVAKRLLHNDPGQVPNGDSSLESLGEWYSDKQVSCPFLKDDICTIYDVRPLACREYLVTSPARSCRTDSQASVEKLELPCSILESVGVVAAKLEGTPVDAVMLPLVLPWVLENRERVLRKWPAQEMIQCFLDVVSE